MFHAATRVLCVSNSRQLAYPGLSYRPIRYLHPMRYIRGRDGAPARGRRAHHTWQKDAQTATTHHQGRVRLTRLGLPPRRPPGPLSQHAPSRLGQSGHAAPRL